MWSFISFKLLGKYKQSLIQCNISAISHTHTHKHTHTHTHTHTPMSYKIQNTYKIQNYTNNKIQNTKYKAHTKQYHTVTYLGCLLDGNLSGDSIVINKFNSRFRFLYRKNRFFSAPIRRLLCNSLIQPHLDYACSTWYHNLHKRSK